MHAQSTFSVQHVLSAREVEPTKNLEEATHGKAFHHHPKGRSPHTGHGEFSFIDHAIEEKSHIFFKL